MSQLSLEQQIHIIGALTEGVSIRGTERLTGAHRDSIMRLGVRVGKGCARLHDRLFRELPTQLLQLDEIWSFIQKKQKRLQATDPASWGDSYTWIALDAANKAVVSYHVGKRSWEDCYLFIRDLRARLVQQVQITSDGYAPYAPTIRAAFGWNVDYAQLQKVYEEDTEGDRRAQRRYSNHAAAISLHVAWYNLCRVHETLRTTPAMALGVSNHIWTIGELVDAALTAPKPAPTLPVPPTPVRPASRGVQLRVIRGGRIIRR